MTEQQEKDFYALLARGINRQVAVESLGVPFEPVQERLNLGRAEALEGTDSEDARFYLKVRQTEAEWEIAWYEEKVLENAQNSTDVTKVFEPLARRNPNRYASPGSLKVFNPDSGGQGPGPAIIRKAHELEDNVEED